jgi:hypothetical protein
MHLDNTYSLEIQAIIKSGFNKTVKWSIAALFIVFTALFLLIWLIRYPYIVSVPLEISSLKKEAIALISKNKLPDFYVNRELVLLLKNRFNKPEYDSVKGKIVSIGDTQTISGQYAVTISLYTPTATRPVENTTLFLGTKKLLYILSFSPKEKP